MYSNVKQSLPILSVKLYVLVLGTKCHEFSCEKVTMPTRSFPLNLNFYERFLGLKQASNYDQNIFVLVLVTTCSFINENLYNIFKSTE